MGKGGKEKHQRIFVRRSIAMDPKPLNQNNAFCEGRFFFFFPPFIAKLLGYEVSHC